MNKIYQLTYRTILCVALCMAAAWSCTDDYLDDPTYVPVDGSAPMDVTIGFMPMSEAMADDGAGSRATVAPPGDGMNTLDSDDICLLFYDTRGKLAGIYSSNDFEGFSVDDVPRDDKDVPQGQGTSGVAAERYTKQAKFRIKDVSFGQYRIYAVANLGRWNGSVRRTTTLEELKDSTSLKPWIGDIDSLRSIQLRWDATNYRNNRQMLGYLTVANSANDKPSTSMEAPAVVLNGRNVSLHAWMKRAASKVTVTFNGEKMRENVRVYLRRATIHDIPLYCSLGKDNGVGADSMMIAQSTHHLDFGEGSDYTKWPSITKGTPTLDPAVWNHNPESYALYFYENRQGDFTNHPDRDRYDKRQWPADDGSVMDKKDKKDNVPYGTYIEVEGYYVSRTAESVTNGKIIYRFMLGQDIYYNFDATRNCHYMLTLNFRGNANDVDWHIEYGEDYPQIYLPEKYYISYLYNRNMRMPVRVNVGSGYELTDMRADIICNNWAPSGSTSAPYPGGTGSYQFTWNKAYYDSHSTARDAYISNDTWTEDPNNFDPAKYNTDIEAGFLSLRRTRDKEILSEVNGSSNYAGKLAAYWKDNNRGWRTYEVPNALGSYTYDSGNDSEDEDGSYTVIRDDSTFTYNLPFFTRAKQMSAWLAYTANNPYPYPRHAVVRVTATFVDKLTGRSIKRSKRVVIEQVERCENPKGIWRAWDNDDDFNVELLRNDPNDLSKFISIVSDGPWRAEVALGQDWIKLDGKLNHIVQGSTGTPIKFQYQPNGKCSSASQVRSGVIRVYYNNYTCTHLIFVRQGYASQAITARNSKWSVFNLYSKTQLSKSPLSAGSYFRCGNLDEAILESNNDKYGVGANIGSEKIDIINANGVKTTTTWNSIGSYRRQDDNGVSPLVYSKFKADGKTRLKGNVSIGKNMFSNLTIDKKPYHVATYEDFKDLMNNCEHGYGVLYADGATGVQKTRVKAFEFRDDNNKGTVNRTRGMRGIFAYNTADGRQIFFPITALGHGRRKAFISEGSNNNGVLRYGDVKNVIDPPRVMVYDLNQTPGAMYWIRASKEKGHIEPGFELNSFSWDMNYYAFGFGTYHRLVFAGNDSRGSDGLLIKLIEE